MPSLPIRWILARAYGQVTEDESRVAAALDAAVSGGEVSRDTLEGQFGNPVLLFARRLEDAQDVRATWQRWAEAGILHAVREDLDARLGEDGVLHFRLDKQEAFGGRLALRRDGDAIDIQVKLKAYPAKDAEIRRVARSLVPEAV